MNLKRAIKDVNIRIVAGSFLLLYITQATKIHWPDELYWLMSAFFITLAVSALTTLLLERSLTHRALEDPERQSSRLKQFMSMEDGGFQYFAPKFETFDEEILSKVADRVTTRFCYIVISGRRFHETHLDLLKQLITNKSVQIDIFVPDTETQVGEVLAGKRGVTPRELGKRIETGWELITESHDPQTAASLKIWKYGEIPTYTAYRIDDMVFIGIYRYQARETRMEFYGYHTGSEIGKLYAEDIDYLQRKSKLIYPAPLK